MSQVEPSKTQIQLEEITPEMIQELIKRAKLAETTYLLILERWHRQGNSMYRDDQEYEIIYGDAIDVELGEFDAGYPYIAGSKHLIVPKTVPTIVKVERCNDSNEPPCTEELYIFTKHGWVSVVIR